MAHAGQIFWFCPADKIRLILASYNSISSFFVWDLSWKLRRCYPQVWVFWWKARGHHQTSAPVIPILHNFPEDKFRHCSPGETSYRSSQTLPPDPGDRLNRIDRWRIFRVKLVKASEKMYCIPHADFSCPKGQIRHLYSPTHWKIFLNNLRRPAALASSVTLTR